MRGRRAAPARPRRGGNYAVLFGLTLTVMVGMAALAIDHGWLRVVRFELSNAADAGAHAALVELRASGDPAAAEAAALDVIALNSAAGTPLQPDDATVVFGTWDFTTKVFTPGGTPTNAVQVSVSRVQGTGSGAVPTFLASVLDVDWAELGASGEALGALRSREILVVQDVTGSFQLEMGHMPDDLTDPPGSHPSGVVQDAVLGFLDILNDMQLPGDKIGMVTFTGGAEVWTDLQPIEGNYNAIRAQWETLDWCNRSYWPWDCLQYNYFGGMAWYCGYVGGSWYRLMHTAPQVQDCNTGGDSASDSGTSQGAGIELAVDILTDPALTDPFALKTIVIVSDGKPQCVPSTTSCDQVVADYGLDMADWAAANDISIFSVSFNESGEPEQSAYMESLVRGYGAFYETPDIDDLPGILEDIAASIPIALVQ